MKKLILLSIVILFGVSTVNATIWRVNNMPDLNADFTSLQDAIEAASDGDIIYIEGTGLEYGGAGITLTKSLTFYGSGYYLLENEDTQANHHPVELDMWIDIDPGAAGSQFYGIKFQGYHVYIGTHDITIERCYIYAEIRIHASEEPVSNLMMKQCVVFDIGMWTMNINSSNLMFVNNIFYEGLSLGSDLANYTVKNNIFIGGYSGFSGVNSVVQNNIVGGGITSYVGNNNLVENNIIAAGTTMPETGSNNIGDADFAEVFVDYPNGENTSPDAMYELKEGSIAIGHGIGGIDCGIFDGDFPYVLSGLPSIPRFYESNISTLGTSQGLRVSFKAKSQH